MKYKVIKLEGNKSVLVDESAEIKGLYHDSFTNKLYQSNGAEYVKSEQVNNVVATINHSIDKDVPMVIVEDEVEKFLFKLCYYDLRNLDNCINTSELTKEELTIPQVHGEDFANALCSCDNCFYGKTEMAEYIINKATQQKSYSEEDLRKYHNIMCLHGNIAGEEFIQFLKQEYIKLEMEIIRQNQCVNKCASYPSECLCEMTKQIRTDRVDGQLMAYQK